MSRRDSLVTTPQSAGPGRARPGTGATRGRLADLASYAGVSEATVSRVLNDRPGVAPATRQSVITALDVLGYDRPSRLRPRTLRWRPGRHRKDSDARSA